MGYLPKDYVPVHTRVEQFHEKYPTGSINTEFNVNGEIVMFKATITIPNKETVRTFNGSSFGKVGKEKAFEKLETVSVGRALAFAGFEIQSGIASQEEMEVFQAKKKSTHMNQKFNNDIPVPKARRDMTEIDLEKLKQSDFIRKYPDFEKGLEKIKQSLDVTIGMYAKIKNLYEPSLSDKQLTDANNLKSSA